jgi:hypothetical protein
MCQCVMSSLHVEWLADAAANVALPPMIPRNRWAHSCRSRTAHESLVASATTDRESVTGDRWRYAPGRPARSS